MTENNSINLNNPDFFQNPYPFYAKLRTSGKPYWLPHKQESTSNGVLLFTRYKDALTIFKETTKISKEIRSVRPKGTENIFDLHILHRDGIDHSRLRLLISKYFSMQYISNMEDLISSVAETLIEDIKKKKTTDLIIDYAEQLPLHIIADLMGIPVQDMKNVRKWSLVIGDSFDSLLINDEILIQQKKSLTSFLAYVNTIIADKKNSPDDTLIGFLIDSEEKNKISSDELVAMVSFLLFAGHETTINLIGNGLWLLLSHPEQWQLLQDKPDLLPNAVEEILRYESPEQRTSFRTVKEPMDINGTKVNKGDQIGVVIGSANHDESEFENAHIFDIQRTPNRHLAFGIGTHNCLGKTLARVETQIALQKILEHLPRLQLIDHTPCWRKNSFFRGLSTLHANIEI